MINKLFTTIYRISACYIEQIVYIHCINFTCQFCMLYKLSSAASSKVSKEIVRREIGYSYLQSALTFGRTCRISLGVLFCREFNASICSGVSSSGSTWGYSVYSKLGQFTEEERQTIEYQDVEYDIKRSSVSINYFDFILHHNVQSCGCDSFRIDLCLPKKWCAKVYESNKDSASQLIKELLEESRRGNEHERILPVAQESFVH